MPRSFLCSCYFFLIWIFKSLISPFAAHPLSSLGGGGGGGVFSTFIAQRELERVRLKDEILDRQKEGEGGKR